MIIKAVDLSGNEVDIDYFFKDFDEFSSDENLLDNSSRKLKVILRHPDDVGYVATKSEQGYFINVEGKERTYKIYFEISPEELTLKGVE